MQLLSRTWRNQKICLRIKNHQHEVFINEISQLGFIHAYVYRKSEKNSSEMCAMKFWGELTRHCKVIVPLVKLISSKVNVCTSSIPLLKVSDSASSEIYMSSFYNLFKICIRICFEINKVFFLFQERGKGEREIGGIRAQTISLPMHSSLTTVTPFFSPFAFLSFPIHIFTLTPPTLHSLSLSIL